MTMDTMTEHPQAEEGAYRLALPAVLDLTAAPELKLALETALAAGNGCHADASEVQRVTTPCLQVLAAAAKSFREAGGAQLTVHETSTAFNEAVVTLGLCDALGMDGGAQ